MLSYYLKCRKNMQSKNPEVAKTKKGRITLLSKYAVCNSKKSKYLKEEEAKELISYLTGRKIPILSDLPILNAVF